MLRLNTTMSRGEVSYSAGMVNVPKGFPTKDNFSTEDFNRFFDSSRGAAQVRECNQPVWEMQEPTVSQPQPSQPRGPVAWNAAPGQSLWSEAFEIGAKPELPTHVAPRSDISIPKTTMSHDWSVWSRVDTS